MTYQQYSYNYSSQATNSPIANSQLLVPGSVSLSTSSTPSCDVTARVLAPESSPPSGGSAQQTMYSASGLLSYPRVAGLADTVYSSAYATQGYVPFGTDPSAFYSPLTADNTDAWRSLSGTAGWAYDPNAMAGYPYGTSYGGLDVRRKNATRESTSTLKAWLYEHIKNPYPTKGEKIMLAIITKMTLTQVSTWFANARRRLKKENKMQWSPRNRSGEDDDHKSDDDNDDGDDGGNDSIHGNDNHHSNNNNNSKSLSDGADIAANGDDLVTTNFNSLIHDTSQKDLLSGNHGHHVGPVHRGNHLLDNGHETFGNLRRVHDDPLQLRRDEDEDIVVDGGENDPLSRLDFPGHDHPLSHPRLKADDTLHHKLDTFDESPLSQLSTPIGSPHHSLGDALLSHGHHLGVKGHGTHCSTSNDVSPVSSKSPHDVLTPGGDISKPRIWSLADVATSSTPPPGRRSPNSLVSSSLGASTHPIGGAAINKGGLTAFTAPVTSQCHVSSFQPWIGPGYAGGTPHNHSGLSYGYSLNNHQSLGGVTPQMVGSQPGHSLSGIGLSNTPSYSTGAKLTSGFLGEKPSLNQFQTGFNSNVDMSQTAFKPVPKRL